MLILAFATLHFFFYLILYNYLIMNVVYLNRNVNIKISLPNISLSSKNKAGGKILCVFPGRPKILYYMKYSGVKASEKATFSVLSSLRRFPFLSLCSVQYIGAFHNFAVVPTFLKYSASLLNFFVRSFFPSVAIWKN